MSRTHLKILLADDDLEDLELIEEHILSIEPTAELDKFTDGLSAFEYLCSRSDSELPSLIVLDYNMPGLNGSELLSSLNAGNRCMSIPKIVVSSSNNKKFIDECLRNGATEYIVKPDNVREIHSLAQKLVSLAANKH